MIQLVISGGQTGADQAGWRSAQKAGIPTGGWMPKGFLTEDGCHPEFADIYGAKEHDRREYPPRTRLNARAACITIWFGNPKSPGGILTIREARINVAFVYIVESSRSDWTPKAVSRHILNAFDQQRHFDWGPSERDRTINIAGNRESKSPGIGKWVEQYLDEVFAITQQKDTP